MTAPRVAALSFVAGASFALGWMTALAIRSIYTITAGGRWYHFRQL